MRAASLLGFHPNAFFTTVLTAARVASTLVLAPCRKSDDSLSRPSPGQTNDPYVEYLQERQMPRVVKALRTSLGPGKVDEKTLEKWSGTAHSTVNSTKTPHVIVYPSSTEDVVSIVQIASAYKVPLVPISGQTSLEGNNCTTHGGIVIGFRDMAQVIQVYPEDEQAVVQPGLNWKDLNNDNRLRSAGLFFPIDPGPEAQFGGMIGTNCSGTNAVRYSTMRSWVINLTLVTVDGRVIKTGRRAAKTSAGYSIKDIVVGSEGTLGIVTEITIKLAPVPEMTRVAVASFKNCRDAIDASLKIRRRIGVQCLELMDKVQMDAFNHYMADRQSRLPDADCLFLKFSGRQDVVGSDTALAEEMLAANGAITFKCASSDHQADEIWKARKDSLWAMKRRAPKNYKPFSTDVCVPRSRLADIIEWSRMTLDSSHLFASILGHVGDGNFHCSIFYNDKDEESASTVRRFNKELVQKALELEGTCTGEHGVGIGKMASLREELGDPCLDIMRSIKRALDPAWIFNPGKIFLPTKEHQIIEYSH